MHFLQAAKPLRPEHKSNVVKLSRKKLIRCTETKMFRDPFVSSTATTEFSPEGENVLKSPSGFNAAAPKTAIVTATKKNFCLGKILLQNKGFPGLVFSLGQDMGKTMKTLLVFS